MSSPAADGALLGLCGGGGLVLAVLRSPPVRRVRLVDRVAPYLGLADPAPDHVRGAMAVVVHVVAPTVAPALERFVGGSASIRRRLEVLGAGGSVDAFRLEQLSCAIVGLVCLGGVGAGLRRPPLVVAALGVAGLVAGFLGRDWWLGRRLKQQEAALLAELPLIADLLALAVIAGESAPEALGRVARITNGELAIELRHVVAVARTGTTLTAALTQLAERSSLDALSRFLQGIVVALDRGTPLAGVLRSQAEDVRELTKRQLLELGGRREISMMLPVVFLILPVTVLFALYPGLLTLTSIAR